MKVNSSKRKNDFCNVSDVLLFNWCFTNFYERQEKYKSDSSPQHLNQRRNFDFSFKFIKFTVIFSKNSENFVY